MRESVERSESARVCGLVYEDGGRAAVGDAPFQKEDETRRADHSLALAATGRSESRRADHSLALAATGADATVARFFRAEAWIMGV